MLTKLIIENIALVRKLELSFASGLSALTGETGAGKSVIVTALSLALGDRADKEQIRHGAGSAQVTAVFDVSHLPSSLRREHADLIDGDSMTVRRFINRDGASRMSVNGKRIGLSRWKPLAAALGEILSQHASQSLMNEDNHLMFLDRFAELSSQVEATAEAFVNWRNVADELRRLKDRREQLIQQRELLLFQ
ncbi:MAG: AAA family ATPase [candidate division Zixibacteria bacterium]|nr:AAA family ATPase [candidate division Zixibacteria bacterium]